MKTKLLLITLCTGLFLYTTTMNAQTTLVPGDIAVIQNQTDTPDDFAFVTFVDLAAGTVIYFTDCGADAAGFNTPCTEGAFSYTVPAGGHAIGAIIKFEGSSNPNFAIYSDSRITGTFATSTAGDQIVVFQDASSASGSSNAGNNPAFIFVSNSASTAFTGDKTDTNQTGVPAGLQDTTAPVTALGLGTGPGPQDEWDNVVYNGGYTFNTVADAKLALTDPANYYGSSAITDGTYVTEVSEIPAALTITTLSSSEVELSSTVFLSPNPSNGNITIKNAGNVLEFIVVTDINGRQVSRLDLNGSTEDVRIDLSNNLSSGLYFMTISTANQSTVKKIIIN